MDHNKKTIKQKRKHLIILIVMFTFLFLGEALLSWYKATFGVTFAEILFTAQSPLVGADIGFLYKLLPYVVDALAGLAVTIGVVAIVEKISDFGNKNGILYKRILLVTAVLGACMLLVETDRVIQITNYVKYRMQTTEIYENYYVDPTATAITSDHKRNIIHIYLESMETTYASEDIGGKQGNNNYIESLSDLAEDSISFSNNEMLGGFHCISSKSGWTTGAIFSTETGLPYSLPAEGNSMDQREVFASGAVAFGDILEGKGYYQEFLCGSDANFGGRKQFYEQHGNYKVYDLYNAIEDGYIKEDELVWWGLEDKNLYRIAKDQLTEIGSSDQPFNFTMLTVDTHHVDGWVCDLCDDTYPDQLANVLVCADDQISEFISWCMKQPWYDNTTIIIQGDHPRMDQALVDGIEYYDRTVYNCFINTVYDDKKEKLRTKNREFLTFDMFPAMLAAMGYSIEGDRLGLGTNLFSDRDTMCEELGFGYVEQEVCKYSKYYERFY